MRIHTSRNRRGASATETTMIGCGVLLAAVVICGGIAFYYAGKNIKAGETQDPVKLGEWIREEVRTEVPKGYQPLHGMRANVLGTIVLSVVIGPPGASKPKEEPDPTKTIFTLMRLPNADTAEIKFGGDAGQPEVVPEKTELTVSEKRIRATKWTAKKKGRSKLFYQVPLRKNLVLLAEGPAEGFDKASLDDFLGTMTMDQPGDLPTAMEAKKPNGGKQ